MKYENRVSTFLLIKIFVEKYESRGTRSWRWSCWDWDGEVAEIGTVPKGLDRRLDEWKSRAIETVQIIAFLDRFEYWEMS